MRWSLMVWCGAVLMHGCKGYQELTYPLHLTVEHRTLDRNLIAFLPGEKETRILFDYRGRVLQAEYQGKLEPLLLECDTVVDVHANAEGYLVAAACGDSTVFWSIRHVGMQRRIGSILGRKGYFIPGSLSTQCAWNNGSSITVLSHSGLMNTYQVLLPFDREQSHQLLRYGQLYTISQRAPQLLFWESIDLTSGQKRFSTLLAGNLNTTQISDSNVVSLNSRPQGYVLEWYMLDPRTIGAVLVNVLALPSGLYEPQFLVTSGDTVLAVFRNGVVAATHAQVLGMWNGSLEPRSSPRQLTLRTHNQIVVLGSGYALVCVVQENPWWWIERSVPIVYRVIALGAVGIVVVWIIFRARRNRNLTSTLLERGSQGAMIVLDKRLRLRQLNSRARQLFSIEPSVPLKRSIENYQLLCNVPGLIPAIEQVAHERMSALRELVVHTGDEERTFLASLEPVTSSFGRLEGIVVALFDVTVQYQHWQLVNWAQLAHDMQTSLATIRLNAEQLVQYAPEHLQSSSKRILHQATLLLDRVRDILALGRGDELQEHEANVQDLFAEAVTEVQNETTAHISFVVRPSPLVLRLDKRRILRALHNALTNAVRAIGHAGGSIELWADLSKDAITLCIRDSGSGMDQHTLSQLQRPFFTTNRTSGHGMGMMIIRRMVELHGGTVQIESAPGKGTTVMFHLPRWRYVRRYS